MEIICIYEPYIYSVQYDNMDENEFDRLFNLWNDLAFVTSFLHSNAEYLQSDFWKGTHNVESASDQVLNEAVALETLFDELYQNSINGHKPDFDSHFKYLDGKYKYQMEWSPMKSYGTMRPSFLRIYAIRVESNKYIITGGGIKLSDTIQNSPDLKDHVLQNIDKVKEYIKAQGIVDGNDL